jgi:c(7)-type cytochrome triheme protein
MIKLARVSLLIGLLLFLVLYISTYRPLRLLAQSTSEDESVLLEEEDEDEEEEDTQEPIAFNYLPKTELGYIDWVAAIKQGIITPKESLDPNYHPMPPIDFNVRFEFEAPKNNVLFPHLPHTLWLDCRNCHPAIFRMQAGTNPITMEKILRGEFCGRCHGVVAFPISDCDRCHSQPKPEKK